MEVAVRLFEMSQKMSVTEIQVRMDCNGCVQKIKKALHGVAGICELYVNFPQQKVTVMGWTDPVNIVKAIKKMRKTAVICSHTEQSDEASQPEPELEPEPESEPEHGGGAQPPHPESAEQPQAETAPPAEAQTEEEEEEEAALPSQPRSPPSEPETAKETRNQSTHHSKPQNVEEIHVIYRHPPDYGSRYTYNHYPQGGNGSVQWNTYPNGLPQPIQVTQSYNTYRASPHVTEYAFPGQMQQPPPPPPSHFVVPEPYSRVSQIRGEPPQPPQPQPIHYYNRNSTYSSGPEIQGEMPRPPQTAHHYGGQWNGHPSSSQLRTEPQHSQPSQTIHYYSGNSSNAGQWNAYPTQPPRPIHATQSYNMYMPSPYTTEYAQHPQSSQGYSRYSAPDNYNQVYYNGNSGHISSMFSEENPNACTIA